jgi:hypothetical protein
LDGLFGRSRVEAFFWLMVKGESLKAAKDIMGKGIVLVKEQVEEWKE